MDCVFTEITDYIDSIFVFVVQIATIMDYNDNIDYSLHFSAKSFAKVANFLRYSWPTHNLNLLNLTPLILPPSAFAPPPPPPSHPHLNHSATFIPTPTPCLLNFTPNPDPPSYILSPLPQFVYHLTGTGEGVTQCEQTYLPPFSIFIPSPKFYVPVSLPPPPPFFFTPPTFSKRGGF